MKVTSVDLYSGNSEIPITLSFRDPRNQTPFQVIAMSGIDADELLPKYYGSASNNPNEKYYDLSVKSRVIVIKIGLNPIFGNGQTYSDLRDQLYRMISSSRSGVIRLVFKNGNVETAEVRGLFTKFEADHFSKSPAVYLTISCEDGMLKAPERTIVDTEGMSHNQLIIQDDVSTAPHGLIIEATFIEPNFPYFILLGDGFDWVFWLTVETLGGFLVDDKLIISSEVNNLEVLMIRDTITYNLGGYLLPGSIWPVVFPGETIIGCSGGISWDLVAHYPSFFGV